MTFKQHGADPATRQKVITPSPSSMLDPYPRAIVVLTAGNVEMVDVDGTSIVYPFAAGTILPFRPVRIGTSTTSTVVGWY